MTPSDNAKTFLNDDPAEWLTTTEKLCSSILRWLGATRDISRVELQRTQLYDILFAELTSPAFVTLLAATSSVDDASRLVLQTLKEQILCCQIEVEAVTEEQEYWGDIIDLSAENRPVRRWTGDFIDGYANRLLTEYEPLQFDHNWTELSNVIMAALVESPPRISVPDTPVLRLNVIDLALYRALCQHPELLRTLDWRTFERLLADILDSFGFAVELQRGTKDGGVDIFAVMKSHPMGPQRYLLQAKSWSNAVGLEPVRQLAFLHTHYKATKSCLATTATFTRGAWELANQYRWQINLKDYDGLVQWVNAAALNRFSR
jgi:HJR/Mrr/RecB family endonuclease